LFEPLMCVCCSKTVVHPAPRKILESVADQENISVTSGGKPLVPGSDSASGNINPNAVSGKRLGNSCGKAPAKKSKVVKTAPKPKVVSLQKGQKKLSAFFRM